MKKIWLAVAMVGTLGLVGYQIADAGPGWNGGMMEPGYMMGPGYGYGGGPQQGARALDEDAIKARDKFFEETKDLRKELTVKNAELSAVMNQEKPDEKKVAKLSGEIFDLRTQMREKAQESGLHNGYGPGAFGPGYCQNFGGGQGMGRGYGRHGYGHRRW